MTDGAVPIRVLVADDQALVRAGFRMVLDLADDIEVVGEAADGREAVALTAELRPDVVLMDIRMPVVDGLEAAKAIVRSDPRPVTRVVMLTTFELDEYVVEALRAGASGFLLKDIEPEDLRQAVRVIASGNALLSPSVTRKVIAEFLQRTEHRPRNPERLDFLTGREREVVGLVAAGLTNEQIGDRLYISPATAKTHVSRAMVKLHARDRAQLVVIAFETGLAQL